jgi:hypothetical protein
MEYTRVMSHVAYGICKDGHLKGYTVQFQAFYFGCLRELTGEMRERDFY